MISIDGDARVGAYDGEDEETEYPSSMRRPRFGILGGTLDPAHQGHIAVAEAVIREMGLDGALLMPSGRPPHKPAASDPMDRMRMAEIACQGHAGLSACDIEINRTGVTYTVDTLSQLRARQPQADWVYIVGADALDRAGDWVGFERLAGMCAFAAVGRPGRGLPRMREKAETLKERYGAQITVLEINGPDISSSEIRRRVAEGKPIEGLVSPEVEAYIRTRGLYLCDYAEAALLEKLKGMITPHRYQHTLGVAETAQRLAPKCGVDPMRARLAGLLHDCAKSMPLEEMRALVRERLLDTDAAELDSRAILHAPAGMVVAEREFGVRDPAILEAIRRHTVGGPNMTAMDALIYVSDFIEPNREEFPGLKKARQAAEEDIFKAMRVCAELTAKHLKSRGQEIHPRTLQLLETSKGGNPT